MYSTREFTPEVPRRMFEMLRRFVARAQSPFHVKAGPGPGWRESVWVCALADSERHLGHTIRVGNCWIAYDGMHLSPTGDGFRIIGTFVTIAAAKRAVEENAEISWAWAAAGGTVEPAAGAVACQPRTQVATSLIA